MSNPIVISVDAMGGDHYPKVPIEGAVLAMQNDEIPRSVNIELIGPEQLIRDGLVKHGKNYINHPRLSIVNASEEVVDGESIKTTLRKKESSMWVGLTRQKTKLSAAFVSAGNTGALMVLSRKILELLPGITGHPAMAGIIPTENGDCVHLDLGGSVDNTATQLVQWAVMGDIYSRYVVGVSSPRIGLMNVGTEAGKGDRLRRKAFGLLRKLDEAEIINFVGSIEGSDILVGKTDVVVFDGFTANVQLKLMETIVPSLGRSLRKTLKQGSQLQKVVAAVALILLKPTMRTIKSQFDYQRYNGAPFLGLDGVSVKAHGKSTPLAFMYAIRRAYLMVEQDVVGEIKKRIGEITDILEEVR